MSFSVGRDNAQWRFGRSDSVGLVTAFCIECRMLKSSKLQMHELLKALNVLCIASARRM